MVEMKMLAMKNKIIGVIMISLSLLFLLWQRNVFVNAGYFLVQQPDWITTTRYLVMIGQIMIYLTATLSAIAFSYSILTKEIDERRQSKRTLFFVGVVLFIVLELPVYRCESFPGPGIHSGKAMMDICIECGSTIQKYFGAFYKNLNKPYEHHRSSSHSNNLTFHLELDLF
jgi:hypothetical protein